MTKAGNSSWLAELVAFIKGKVDDVHRLALDAKQHAEDASNNADNAQQAADQARLEAATALMAGMVWDYRVAHPNSTGTKFGNESKFFIVTAQYAGACMSFIVDWDTVRAVGNSLTQNATLYIPVEGTSVGCSLTASIDSNNEMTFTAPNGDVVYVCGYH
jgi:hypothetical protein